LNISIEKTILSNLVFNEDYARKVLPFLKAEYFQEESDKTVFALVTEHITTYNKGPTKEALILELEDKVGLNQKVFDTTVELIKDLATDNTDHQYLLDKTEQFCQDRALHNALREAVSIVQSEKGSV